MAGFFGLFASKNKESNETEDNGNGKEAFYLSTDEAQSLGNIDYMRTPRTITRTFPTGGSITKQISALEETVVGEINTTSKPTIQAAISEDASITERRRADNSMDLFRNMAQDIKK